MVATAFTWLLVALGLFIAYQIGAVFLYPFTRSAKKL